MVKPKQKRVAVAKEALQLAQESLQQKEESLNKIMDHLIMLQGQYQDSVNQREELKQRNVLTAIRLDRASLLIGALSGEKVSGIYSWLSGPVLLRSQMDSPA
jgi:dynein heavy chain